MYQEHMVTVAAGPPSNYHLTCTCGKTVNVASLSDVFAAEAALRHVQEAQQDYLDTVIYTENNAGLD